MAWIDAQSVSPTGLCLLSFSILEVGHAEKISSGGRGGISAAGSLQLTDCVGVFSLRKQDAALGDSRVCVFTVGFQDLINQTESLVECILVQIEDGKTPFGIKISIVILHNLLVQPRSFLQVLDTTVELSQRGFVGNILWVELHYP